LVYIDISKFISSGFFIIYKEEEHRVAMHVVLDLCTCMHCLTKSRKAEDDERKKVKNGRKQISLEVLSKKGIQRSFAVVATLWCASSCIIYQLSLCCISVLHLSDPSMVLPYRRCNAGKNHSFEP
jgi:hypothetical protein